MEIGMAVTTSGSIQNFNRTNAVPAPTNFTPTRELREEDMLAREMSSGDRKGTVWGSLPVEIDRKLKNDERGGRGYRRINIG